MAQSGQRDGENFVIVDAALAAQARAFVADHEGVGPDVAFGVPFGLLLTADQRMQLGKKNVDDAGPPQKGQSQGRPHPFHEEFLQLFADALCGQGQQLRAQGLAAQQGAVVDVEPEAGHELRGTQHPQGVFVEGV